MLPTHVYCDGGVIGPNPSPLGGTWAFCWVRHGMVIRKGSGVITPADAQLTHVTNNLTELLAVVQGLTPLPPHWTGWLCTDSAITIQRLKGGFQGTSVPDWLKRRVFKLRARSIRPQYLLLGGHPTAAELAAGTLTRNGRPCSPHNVWCDEECGRRATAWRAKLAKT